MEDTAFEEDITFEEVVAQIQRKLKTITDSANFLEKIGALNEDTMRVLIDETYKTLRTSGLAIPFNMLASFEEWGDRKELLLQNPPDWLNDPAGFARSAARQRGPFLEEWVAAMNPDSVIHVTCPECLGRQALRARDPWFCRACNGVAKKGRIIMSEEW